MKSALQRIKEDMNHHIDQISKNNHKIDSYMESIRTLEDCNAKEQQLVEEYEEIIKRIEGAGESA
ncbi:hypothetical protein MKY20_11310 [Cytobacillus sp. FSL W8-0315]|uniref:hypothetical protein n=1 Tax=Cytobacillus sp. FSL W8-0315 TaxID=2921600 RepID=UPI0030FBB612